MSASSGARSAGRSRCLDIRHLQQAADLLRRALVPEKYCSLYLMGAFWMRVSRAAEGGVQGGGKKLDMGKCCVHFESPDDLPLEAIGKLISTISSEKWIEMYEQSRLRTKAGQAQIAKQGAHRRARWPPSAPTQSGSGKLSQHAPIPGLPARRTARVTGACSGPAYDPQSLCSSSCFALQSQAFHKPSPVPFAQLSNVRKLGSLVRSISLPHESMTGNTTG